MNTKNQKYTPRENHPWKTSYKVNLTRRLNGEAENLPKIKNYNSTSDELSQFLKTHSKIIDNMRSFFEEHPKYI